MSAMSLLLLSQVAAASKEIESSSALKDMLVDDDMANSVPLVLLASVATASKETVYLSALKNMAVDNCLYLHAMDQRNNPRPRGLEFFREKVNKSSNRGLKASGKCLTQNDLAIEIERRHRVTPDCLTDNYTKSSLIYFQRMIDDAKHSLRQHIPNGMKNHDHLPDEDVPLIEEELIVLPPEGGRMIYLVENLHNTPHGSELVSNLSNITKKIKQNNIKCTTIDSTSYLDTGEVDLRAEWGLGLCWSFKQ